MKKLLLLILILFLAPNVNAQSIITINAGQAPYTNIPALVNVNVYSDTEVREAALSGAAGMYRSTRGLSSLPTGARFRMVYSDGTVEIGEIISPVSSLGAVPVPGTQRDANGRLITSVGGSGGGGGSPIGGGSYCACNGTVTVGPVKPVDDKPDPNKQ